MGQKGAWLNVLIKKNAQGCQSGTRRILIQQPLNYYFQQKILHLYPTLRLRWGSTGLQVLFTVTSVYVIVCSIDFSFVCVLVLKFHNNIIHNIKKTRDDNYS